MKKYLLALAGLALLEGAPLLGQTPVPIVIQRESRAGPTAPQEIVVGPGGAHGKIICVPEHYTKKTDHWCYGHVDMRVCLCYFHGLFGKCGCDHGRCEHPYCRRVLVKKRRVEECEQTRCVPREVPDCEGGHCHGPGGHHASAGTLPGVAPGTVHVQGAPVIVPGQIPPMPPAAAQGTPVPVSPFSQAAPGFSSPMPVTVPAPAPGGVAGPQN
jgi:hypothetical protein